MRAVDARPACHKAPAWPRGSSRQSGRAARPARPAYGPNGPPLRCPVTVRADQSGIGTSHGRAWRCRSAIAMKPARRSTTSSSPSGPRFAHSPPAGIAHNSGRGCEGPGRTPSRTGVASGSTVARSRLRKSRAKRRASSTVLSDATSGGAVHAGEQQDLPHLTGHPGDLVGPGDADVAPGESERVIHWLAGRMPSGSPAQGHPRDEPVAAGSGPCAHRSRPSARRERRRDGRDRPKARPRHRPARRLVDVRQLSGRSHGGTVNSALC